MNCSTHTFLQAIETIRKISERLPDTVILLGGYHATFAAEPILRGYPFIDYIIKGEAEEAIIDLLDCIEKGEKPHHVAGISFLDEGRHVSNELAVVQDLDALPMPDRQSACRSGVRLHHAGHSSDVRKIHHHLHFPRMPFQLFVLLVRGLLPSQMALPERRECRR